DHECRINPNPKLADEIESFACLARVFRAIAWITELFQKGAGSRARDGAQMLGKVLAQHANAIVLDGEALCVLVDRNSNDEGIWGKRRLGKRLVAQFLAGIG